MTSLAIKQQLREFVASLGNCLPGDDEDLFGSGILDSMGYVDLLLFLEKEFAIEIDPEDFSLENLISVDAIHLFVVAQLEGSP